MDKTQATLNTLEKTDLLRNMIGNLTIGGLFVDRARVIRDCNAAAERLFGYAKGELLGRRTEVLYGDRRTDKNDRFEIYNRLEGDGYHIGTASGIRKGGGVMPLTLYTFVVKKQSGAIVLVKETAPSTGDATDTGRLLQDLLDTIPDMIFFKDAENRFIMVNAAHAAALGRAPAEIIGKTDLDLFPKELGEKYVADDSIVVQTGSPVLDKIEAAPRPDGGITYVSTTKIPRFGRDGRVIGTIGITRNVTERVAAEQEVRRIKEHLEDLVKERTRDLEENQENLLRMYHVKSEFVAMVSHELRTPIAVIKESIGLVEDGTTGAVNEHQKKFLGTALKNIDRLSRLINDVLDLSKLESNKIKFRIVSGNLNELIDQVLKGYEPVIRKKGLTLRVDLDPRLPLVRFDPDRITQVLYNLITNAVKFTETGTVEVRSRRDDHSALVSVTDSGRGIKAENLHRIFERFEQVGRADGGKDSGTGLGLAICKQIVEHLGGRIWAESEHGKGSTFTFTLPAEKEKGSRSKR